MCVCVRAFVLDFDVMHPVYLYLKVRGYGLTGDAHHIAAPTEDGDGPRRAMLAAIGEKRAQDLFVRFSGSDDDDGHVHLGTV